jgi:hypothetical protein
MTAIGAKLPQTFVQTSVNSQQEAPKAQAQSAGAPPPNGPNGPNRAASAGGPPPGPPPKNPNDDVAPGSARNSAYADVTGQVDVPFRAPTSLTSAPNNAFAARLAFLTEKK